MRRVLAAACVGLLLSACGSIFAPSNEETGAAWPNEPPGLTTLTEQPWNAVSDGTWRRRPSSNDRISTDPTAPVSPDNVLEYVYPAGSEGGVAPATHYHPLDGQREIFIGLQWKVSEPWQGHTSGVNKIQFLYAQGADVAMVMYGRKGGPYELRVMPQWREHDGSWLTGNAGASTVIPGRWHRIEWYVKYESTYGAGDGTIRWWLDGALAGNYTNIRFPDNDGFLEYQISPTWGGVGDVKTQTDRYWFDHTYISTREEFAPPVGEAVLFSEEFEDERLEDRGWYDIAGWGSELVLSTAEARSGRSSLEVRYAKGSTGPWMRRSFAAQDRVYTRYYRKWPANWQWSSPAGPHDTYLFAMYGKQWFAPTTTYLTVYTESGYAGAPRGQPGTIGLDLARVLQGENDRALTSISPPPPSFELDRWHCIETLAIMNTPGTPDGRLHVWLDARPVFEITGLLLRDVANGSLQFDVFMFGPYFHFGTPQAQSTWIDGLVVATGRIGCADA